MKRETLFRAKPKESVEWLYGDLNHGLNDEMYIRHIVSGLFQKEAKVTMVDKETIGQLIFVINGHKYFEGDIVGTDKNNVHYVLLWNKENQCFSTFSSYDVKFIDGKDDLLALNILANREQVRVTFLKKYNFYPVGNIHDNPELIKQESDER